MEIDNQPEIVTIWNEAKSCVDRGDYDKAIEIYKYILVRYCEDNTAQEYAHAYLGDVYLNLRNIDLAEGHVNTAMGYNPEKPEYHYLLGFIYSIQHSWNKAITEFEKCIKQRPDDAEYLRGLGWAYFNAGAQLKGLSHLQTALELEPSNLNILLDLANVYLLLADFSEAKNYAAEALRLQPGNNLARQVLSKIEEFRKAHEKLKKIGK
jgi:tetratricopeptide (TPR) repeat protein